MIGLSRSCWMVTASHVSGNFLKSWQPYLSARVPLKIRCWPPVHPHTAAKQERKKKHLTVWRGREPFLSPAVREIHAHSRPRGDETAVNSSPDNREQKGINIKHSPRKRSSTVHIQVAPVLLKSWHNSRRIIGGVIWNQRKFEIMNENEGDQASPWTTDVDK